MAMISVRVPAFDVLINGRPRTILTEGTVDQAAMRKSLLSAADLLQALREHSVPENPALARQVILERNGVISVLKRSQ